MSEEPRISNALTGSTRREGALAFGQRGRRHWQQLEYEVGVLAGIVRRHGGGGWLVATDDAYEVALGLLATLHAGAVPVLPANLQPGHLAQIAEGTSGILSDQRLPGRAHAFSLRDLAAGHEPMAIAPIDPERAEIQLHTSGSTGSPIVVHKPLRCLEAEVWVLERLFANVAARTVLATVPPYHIYGLLFRVLWPLAAGRAMARDTIRFPGELVEAARANPAPMLVSSPAFLKRALPALDLATLDGHLRGLFSSGGPLPAEVAAAYGRSLTCLVVEVYGSTETGGMGHRAVDAATAPAPWTPLPGVRLALDPDRGVLMARSPFMPEPGWYRTGDLAKLLPDGRFELCGRTDRIVKIEERRVSLAELEQRLGTSEWVADARMVRLRTGDRGRHGIGAVIVPTPAGWSRLRAVGKKALCASLLESLSQHLDRATLPRRWRFVRRLPENAQGKTSEAALVTLLDEPSNAVRPIVVDRSDGDSDARLTLSLPPDLACFEGHFDGAPILAGVVQLDWAIRFAEERFALTPRVERVEALKFTRVIPAGSEVTLELHYDPDERRLRFRYTSDEGSLSTGRVRFRATP